MSSRLHNKWHRHNHHTNPTPDPDFPDSANDPIASPESPFQGDFVLNGALSASSYGQFAGSATTPAIIARGSTALSATGNVVVNGNITVQQINFSSLQASITPFVTDQQMSHSGRYMPVTIGTEIFYIPLWKLS